MWQILPPITPNVTPIIAPYRVRVIKIAVEVTFGENSYDLTFVTPHPQILSFPLSQDVSAIKDVHKSLMYIIYSYKPLVANFGFLQIFFQLL